MSSSQKKMMHKYVFIKHLQIHGKICYTNTVNEFFGGITLDSCTGRG